MQEYAYRRIFGSAETVDDEKNSGKRRRAGRSIATDFPGKPAVHIQGSLYYLEYGQQAPLKCQ